MTKRSFGKYPVNPQVCALMQWESADLFQPVEGERKPWAVKFVRDGKTLQTSEAPLKTWQHSLDVLHGAAILNERATTEALSNYSNQELLSELRSRMGEGKRYQSEVTLTREEATAALEDWISPTNDMLTKWAREIGATVQDLFEDDWQAECSVAEAAHYDVMARAAYADEPGALAEALAEMKHRLALAQCYGDTGPQTSMAL